MESTGRFTGDLRRLMSYSYDNCQSCGKKLPRTAAYAGYASDGTPLYVGDCCLLSVSELASHIYWWWSPDKRCEPDTILWRYMDFAKFIALLEHKALYFARTDLLGDAFEGAAGIAERRAEWDAYYLDFFREAVRTVPGQDEPPTHEHIEREASRLLTELATTGDNVRRSSFVSCWHANTLESEALWRLYCPPSTTGVAVRTDARLLLEALGNNADIELGRVRYLDLRQSFIGINDRLFSKRKSLAHEAEVRAVIRNRFRPSEELGRAMPVDLQKLLVSVVPSPFAPSWFAALVEATLKRYDLEVKISRSELLSEPFF